MRKLYLATHLHHHLDLLAPSGVEQRPLARFPDVTGLGAQHVAEGGAALQSDDDAVDEP